MSVQTTSDNKLSEAKDIANDIIKKIIQMNILIAEATDPETWGSKDFKESYLNDLDEVSQVSIIYKRVLNKIK